MVNNGGNDLMFESCFCMLKGFKLKNCMIEDFIVLELKQLNGKEMDEVNEIV